MQKPPSGHKLAAGESAYPSFGLPKAEAKRAEMQGDPIAMEKLGAIYLRRAKSPSVQGRDEKLPLTFSRPFTTLILTLGLDGLGINP